MSRILTGDCLAIMPTLPAASVDLILTDPPFFRVLDHAWDRQWPTAAAFLAWLGRVADEWRRLLKPNGSLYCFASVDMAARVELLLAERLTVLNSIRWVKPSGTMASRACKEELRSYTCESEAILFCEQAGANGLAGHLSQARKRIGVGRSDIARACGVDSRLVQKWEEEDPQGQRSMPTAEQWKTMQTMLPIGEYEDLRRPFFLTADVPYSDAWAFASVAAYPGKHPCEKPQDLLQHIIRTSTRPGALVLDSFAGSGSAGKAARLLGREFIGIELDPEWAEVARRGLDAPHRVQSRGRDHAPGQGSLF